MNSYLLIFFSTVLLLLTLSQPDRQVNGFTCALEKSELRESGTTKEPLKRPCARKCLKHQTHSEQQNAANLATDCGQQFYAILHDATSEEDFDSHAPQQVLIPVDKKHPAPSLEFDPDPPRFS